MKFSTFATFAFIAVPVVSLKSLRRLEKDKEHDHGHDHEHDHEHGDEHGDDTRVSFLVGVDNIDPCIHHIVKHGLTDDQIRWVYSNYDESQLISSGWDASALKNSDGDDSTHLWSELDANCPAEEILISAPADTYDFHDLTFERFLKEKETGEEDHRDDIFICPMEHGCALFVEANPLAITFITTAHYEKGHPDTTHQVGLKSDEINFVVGFNTDPCIQRLAENGMSHDTLRWIYSSYGEEQLLASNWDPSSVPNNDGDDSTHLWSEIDPDCPSEEIALSAMTDQNYLHDYVFGVILAEKEGGMEHHSRNKKEKPDMDMKMEDHRESAYLCPTEDECAEFVESNKYGITFFTKVRWEEEHFNDTLPVNTTAFIPPYLDFNENIFV